MGKNNNRFPFRKIVGRTFRCPTSGQRFKVVANDEEEDAQGPKNKKEAIEPYCDVPCPGCGGHHRFFPNNSVHRPPP